MLKQSQGMLAEPYRRAASDLTKLDGRLSRELDSFIVSSF